ncbi:hypothetical protein BC567DRAFT_208053 [Phyllosticta citribraziliensis]
MAYPEAGPRPTLRQWKLERYERYLNAAMTGVGEEDSTKDAIRGLRPEEIGVKRSSFLYCPSAQARLWFNNHATLRLVLTSTFFSLNLLIDLPTSTLIFTTSLESKHFHLKYTKQPSMAGFRKWSLKVQEKTMKVFRSSSGEVKEAPSTPKSAAHDESASPLESASAPDKSTNGVTLSEGAHLSKTSKPNRKPYGELETPPTKPAKVETKKHDSHHQSANSTPSPRYTLFPSENISFTKRLPPAEVIRLMREGRMKDAYGKDDGEE